MTFSGGKLTSNSQWRTYQELELIPETVANPASQAKPLVSTLNLLWRALLDLLLDELVEEQRVEYLDRCWALNEFGERTQSLSNSLQRFWVLMN
ncbi:hypothetical protein [Leptodesmis sichuanensis]|uniref:hypothetical protein n=1 Tax=Leptodesmis sichuanensis TaxID=2906798 RepID=UPI001F3268F2|nr:hypothetical protein [Leptodesmis sichuanensis]MCA1995528.1 hypothetical protein [Coleofasciculus sp. S288]UIE38121.1 hypothetical protein KIK02_00190 [Leptodesmis sichuanensis A121]